jgi:hypothetical protein
MRLQPNQVHEDFREYDLINLHLALREGKGRSRVALIGEDDKRVSIVEIIIDDPAALLEQISTRGLTALVDVLDAHAGPQLEARKVEKAAADEGRRARAARGVQILGGR